MKIVKLVLEYDDGSATFEIDCEFNGKIITSIEDHSHIKNHDSWHGGPVNFSLVFDDMSRINIYPGNVPAFVFLEPD